MRATIHGLPYKRIPTTMVHGLAVFAETALNATPHPDGVSTELSPTSIVTGRGKPNYNNMKLEYGEYVQVYDGTTNNSKARTAGAIALYPSESEDGSYHFMSLATGRKIKRRSWTKVPISDLAISRVEAIAARENMPLVSEDNSLNEHDPNAIVDEDEYDKDYEPQQTEEQASDHDLTTDAYTDESDDEDDDNDDDEDDERGHDAQYDDEPIKEEERTAVREEERESPIVETVEEEERESDGNTVEEEEREGPFEQTDMFGEEERAGKGHTTETKHSPQAHESTPKRTGLRPNRERDYSHRYAHLFAQTTATAPNAPEITKGIHDAMHHLVFTQMSAEAGIKKHGQVAEEALMKEFQQFRDMDVFEPMDATTLSNENKKDALKAISVIKEKRCGKIKGRTVADGRKQRDKYTKSETTSPTVSTDALFLTMVVDAHENRDVATADVSGAYLNAEMDDLVIIRLTGKTVDLMCRVNPEWSKYVIFEGKTKVLYLRCNRALYGCVKSGLLWYELFTSVLVGMGFELNPYDPCIANATIKGKQCTICWYVDDTKISHVNRRVVTNILNRIEDRFDKLTITRGRRHEFLGMNIYYPGDGNVEVLMDRYIREAITDSNLHITSSECKTPAASTLAEIGPDETDLPERRAKTFHSIVAKLIYVGTRARGDILPTLGYLCSRVSRPTDNDERKLKRLLTYLKRTINKQLILGADSLNTFSTWVDASFAPHTDKRSHTGGVISFGRGGLICKSQKQKINTKSSTEAELVGASDYLPHTVFVKNFMEAQGFPSTKVPFYQDNESAMKMEQNGRASAGQRSRHIDIRYFFITDISKRKDIEILHCPTKDMLADFFTKPLQGSLFLKFRDVILGHAHINTLRIPEHIIPEERVENTTPVTETKNTSKTVSWAEMVRSNPMKPRTTNRSALSSTQNSQECAGKITNRS